MSRRARAWLVASYEVAGLAVLALFVWVSVLWYPLWLDRVFLSFSTMCSRVAGGFASFGGGDWPAAYLTPGFSLMSQGVSYGPSGDGFASGFYAWGWSLISLIGNALWFSRVIDFLLFVSRFVIVALPLLVVFRILFEGQYRPSGALFSRVSWELRAWWWFEDRVTSPIAFWLRGFFRFFRASGFFAFGALFGLVCLSGVSELMDLVGLYVWVLGKAEFVSALDVFWTFLLTLLYDVRNVPLLVWVALFFWCKNAADFRGADAEIARLWEFDVDVVRKNMGTFTLLVGVMRSGKDKLCVIIVTVLQRIFRENALESMDGYRAMFRWFPWIWLEREIDALVRLESDSEGRVVNGVQAALYVRSLFDGRGVPGERLRAVLAACRRPKMFFNNGIILVPLSAAMADYAKQYFIYSVYSSLIISNGAVNTYDVLCDKGHRKFWDFDVLHRTPSQRRSSFMRSHDIDEDMMRLKKKVDPSDHAEWLAGAAIVYISEYGKDVGNAKTNAGKKVDAEEANANNDGSVWYQQMGGHLAEAGFNHYFKMVCNEQRVGAISSDRVQVAQSIWAIDVKQIEEKTALRLWWLEPALLQKAIDRSQPFMNDVDINRDDRTLLHDLVATVNGVALGLLKRARSLYCYKEYRLPECTLDAAGNLKVGDPIVFYDIYRVSEADAYDSAFLRGFFERFLYGAKRGLFDQPTFKGLTPTPDEFRAQHSYMISGMEGNE